MTGLRMTLHSPYSGSGVFSFCSSTISVMVASVRRSTLATETAFSRATRTTVVGLHEIDIARA